MNSSNGLSQRLFWLLLGGMLLLRLVIAAMLPMMETTEPRYAEMSRLMLEKQDWITPWYDAQTPFWGKPPLSFWAQKIAIDLLGVNDLAPRLPSWLFGLLLLVVVAWLARVRQGKPAILPTMLLFASMALPFVSMGAVMTDVYLALGVGLSLAAFASLLNTPSALPGWLFFVGIGVSMLAKGPVGVVLTGIPIFMWTVTGGGWRRLWRLLPWFRGSVLSAMIALPWYGLAELKTPGFLNYFLLGEHILRFVEPGWAGDLYGDAHERPKGTIWLFWMLGALPWSLVFVWRYGRDAWRIRRFPWPADGQGRFLFFWALAPMLFFTLAGNILPAYVLPGLPAAAVLMHGYLRPSGKQLASGALVAPLVIALAVVVLMARPAQWTSERANVQAYARAAGSASLLAYLEKVPYSASYYSHGAVEQVSLSGLDDWLARGQGERYLVVHDRHLPLLRERTDIRAVALSRSKTMVLFKITGAAGDR
ncbi:ArnT family glycosyltransferase [Hylemonella gracilis]|uniref:ArnT family glycosyltransferase n=1 Tax=Hylemonella gracilis TaxID=80880 RepID=UPI0018CC1D2A|nr:glycosyltransferase family 39 protein [Hylemonella gracilis]